LSDTILVAIITGCLTTIPQIILKISNDRKEIKLKKFELFKQKQLEVVTNFLDSVGAIYDDGGISLREKDEFQKCAQKLLLYFPNIDIAEFDKILESTKQWTPSKRFESLQPLIKELSKSLQDK